MEPTQISIIGAGPAGCAAALYLAERGISSTLIEREIFPREKTCGDALGGYVASVLYQISPDLLKDFIKSKEKIPIKSAFFYSPKFRKIQFETAIDAKVNGPESFICKRIDFDNFLVESVRKKQEIIFLENVNVKEILRENEVIHILDSTGKIISESNLVVFANGSHNILKNPLLNFQKQKQNSAFGIRTYFNNVNWEGDDDSIHIFFIKELLPGYLWIFPSTNGNANVGLATETKIIKNKKLNLEKVFKLACEIYPEIAKRMKGANMVSPWKGLSIPFGTDFSHVYGDNFLVTGDAAALANPLTGEGIGEAMYSGIYAAQQAIKAIEKNNFSAGFLSEYKWRLYRKLGRLNKLFLIAQYCVSGKRKAEIFFILMKKKFIAERALKRIGKLNKG